MKKRYLPFRLFITAAAFAVCTLFTITAMGQNTFDLANVTWSNGDHASNKCEWNGTILTVKDGANIKITGSVTGGKRIVVAENAMAKITLDGVSITQLGNNQSPLLLNSGANLTLVLWSRNTLIAGNYSAGIEAPEGTTLTIGGTGELDVYGGAGIGNFAAGAGAAIGGGGGSYGLVSGTIGTAGGNITITDGIITARGGRAGSSSEPAAGIGGGSAGDGSASGGAGAGIGGGGGGGGFLASGPGGDGGNITITGGTVTAKGGDHGSSMGNGSSYGGAGGNILIYGENTTVTATRGYSGASNIGGGGGGLKGADGNVFVALTEGNLLTEESGTEQYKTVTFLANPQSTSGTVTAILPTPFNAPPFPTVIPLLKDIGA